MLEGFIFTVSYAPVTGTRPLCIIIPISSLEGIITFVLDISNTLRIPFYPTLQKESILAYHIYICIDTKKSPKHPFASINQKELCIKTIKSIQGTKPAGKFWYDLLK